MKILVIPPKQRPYVTEIDSSLDNMQKIVGGYIEMLQPYESGIALICNEEGKLDGLELNRAIFDETGEVIEIICGTFFVCAAPADSEDFDGLSDEQIQKYEALFQYPEEFIRVNGKILAIPLE